MQVLYTLKDEPEEFLHGYGQTYPAMINVDSRLVTRIFDKRNQLGMGVYHKVVDIIEKFGIVNLDRKFMEQDSRKDIPNQELVKFHLYHWLYDCVATLDAVACLFNMKFSVRDDPRQVAMNKRFISDLKEKSRDSASLLNREFSWMNEIMIMRHCIIHREGRLVAGGGTQPCIVIDFGRAFVRDLPLHRKRIPDVTEEYMPKFDAFIEKVLSEVYSWRSH